MGCPDRPAISSIAVRDLQELCKSYGLLVLPSVCSCAICFLRLVGALCRSTSNRIAHLSSSISVYRFPPSTGAALPPPPAILVQSKCLLTPFRLIFFPRDP